MTHFFISAQIATENIYIKYWYYPAILILSTILYIIKNKLKKGKSSNEERVRMEVKQINNPIFNPVNNVNLHIGKIDDSLPKDIEHTEIKNISREALIDSLKSKVKILFIDDDKKFNVVKILKDSGYKNTTSVVDIKNLDEPLVKEANIYFIDINGVGKLLECKNEGLDLALMLKQKYPNKKTVIYSANKNNNAFHEAWDNCDFKLEKNALPYQFQLLVEKYTLELFS